MSVQQTSNETHAREADLRRASLLDFDHLFRRAEADAGEYRSAGPFPHIVLDDLLPQQDAVDLAAEFPSPEAAVNWRQLSPTADSGERWQYRKLGLCAVEQMPPGLRELMFELNSSTFIRFLERLTGIEALLPDPKLQGGGLHQVLPGGVLGVHADFTFVYWNKFLFLFCERII